MVLIIDRTFAYLRKCDSTTPTTLVSHTLCKSIHDSRICLPGLGWDKGKHPRLDATFFMIHAKIDRMKYPLLPVCKASLLQS